MISRSVLDSMDLHLDGHLALGYNSPSQRARVMTEDWAFRNVYCLRCGRQHLAQEKTNTPVHDFHCTPCSAHYQLKAQKHPFGQVVQNSGYRKKRNAIAAGTNPNYIFLRYDPDELAVTDMFAVPWHFVTLSVVSPRKALSRLARRSGWIGSTIRIGALAPDAKVPVIVDRRTVAKETVLEDWARFRFLESRAAEGRRWLADVLACIRRHEVSTKEPYLSNQSIYAFEDELSELHPGNKHIRDKIRQQLQVLAAHSVVVRTGRNSYRVQHPSGWQQENLERFLARDSDQ